MVSKIDFFMYFSQLLSNCLYFFLLFAILNKIADKMIHDYSYL